MTVKTPVFEYPPKARRVLGYLTHEEVPTSYRCLAVHVPHLNIGLWAETLQFEWARIQTVRKDGTMYVCRVLITDAQPETLERVPGFKWFAEEHGYQANVITQAEVG